LTVNTCRHEFVHDFTFCVVALHPNFAIDDVEMENGPKSVMVVTPTNREQLKAIAFFINEDTAFRFMMR
jgi:hypothetical protein